MQEPWIERVIREAQEAGKFDDVAGSGEPIPDLNRPYDPAWWARRWIATERQREERLQIVGVVEQALPRVLARNVVGEVRAGLESLNSKIEAYNARVDERNAIPLLDVAALMAERSERFRD